MKPGLIACCLMLKCFFLLGQQNQDTTKVLDEVVVEAYFYKRPLTDVPASIAILSKADLERFNNTSLLPIFNTVPGVRMEERSPGSYRLSIRGSLIRSPFGIRNVKVYRNGLPLTDGGGNTYLNLFDYSAIEKIEVIKGPAGSLYGAGTGGVVILNSSVPDSTGVDVSSAFGSYGLRTHQVKGNWVTPKFYAAVNAAFLESQGYREQSAIKRKGLNSEMTWLVNSKASLSGNFFFTDIFYETPGGLNKAQYSVDPTKARPAAGPFKSAVEQNASVKNVTQYASLVYDIEWLEKWVSKIGVYYSSTDFKNFAIANYEVRDETNSGARLENSYSFKRPSWKGKFSFGAEAQQMKSPIRVFENNSGNRGQLSIHDVLWSRQILLFSQVEFDFHSGFFVTGGISENWLNYTFLRKFPDNSEEQKSFSPVLVPRVAVLKKIGEKFSIHGSISRGFSPPTLAEVRPSTNVFNNQLQPETGTNYELGFRSFRRKINAELTGYFLRINETIILQRVENGAEYFINAGATNQKGIELTISGQPLKIIKVWGSFSYNHYRFRSYLKFDEVLQKEVNYSGNELTGIAPFVSVTGMDVFLPVGLYTNITYSYTGRIPLNDANDEFANDYFLLNARMGYRRKFAEKFSLDMFLSIDNTFNEKYSLGNDLNARGRRYYNAAAVRNYSAGIKLQIL
jgi:iron complex outermembrane recepter protein